MPFSRPAYPVRRFVLSLVLGSLFACACYFLWLKPQGEIQHLSANRTVQNMGFFHAWQRRDRWLMEPESTQGQQIGLPTFHTGKGLNLTIALTLALLIGEFVLYHRAIEPKTWRKKPDAP